MTSADAAGAQGTPPAGRPAARLPALLGALRPLLTRPASATGRGTARPSGPTGGGVPGAPARGPAVDPAPAGEEARPGAGGAAAAWMELLRVSALFTVPGDALAGAAATGRRANGGTALAVCASLCLYEAGMALNDWADREVDAVERPHRPLPSGRLRPESALAAAVGLTVAGLGIATAAGRPALATATALAGTVWAYDLGLKNTPAGPLAMAAARGLDLLLGASATASSAGGSAGSGHPAQAPARRSGSAADRRRAATLLGAHTLAVTTVSRREAVGGSPAAPLVALIVGGAVSRAVLGHQPTSGRPYAGTTAPGGRRSAPACLPGARTAYRTAAATTAPRSPSAMTARTALAATCTAAYAAAAARPLAHAVLNPSPYLLQRAVGGGIRAMIPLQAALAARAGAPRTALSLLALIPIARRLSRKVSPT